MNSDPGLQNNNLANNQYTSGGNSRSNLKKIIFIVVGVFFAITVIVLVLAFQSKPESQQSKYLKSATIAARKNTPNAKVTNIKVAGGFAIGFVTDPTSQGQAKAGNTIIFKVNNDESMVQLAEGSSFGPLDLLGLGIPLETQANLTGSNISQVKQNLANQCGYSNGAIGFIGFNGSFSPGEWQIDSSTLVGLEQKISNSITNQDANTKSDMKVICISATQKNSNYTINKTTYISTFTLQVQFVTGDGTLTTHTVTFAVGPNYYRSYTLDGINI
jgi:hypothetical protein